MAVTFTRQSPTWADGHTVFAEDAERWEQLGEDVEAWSATYDTQPDLGKGQWGLPGEAFWNGTSNEATPANTLIGNPFNLMHPATLTGLSCRVATAATTGATAHLSVYKWDGTTWNRVAAGSTVPIDSTGIKSITGLSVTLTPGVHAATILASASVTMLCLQGWCSPFGWRTNNANGAPFPDGWVSPRDYRVAATYASGPPTTAALAANSDWERSHIRVGVRL